MSGVSTVITAAGDSRGLFLPAGFDRPKCLLPWQGRAVIEHAIDAYATDLERTTVAIHAGEDDEFAVGARVQEAFPQARVVRIAPGVQGALATALIALDSADPDSPLVVAAGDSAIDGGIGRFIEEFVDRDLDAATVAFPSGNPRWSYLLVDDSGTVQQVAEKRVIGPLATTGVFYFRSAAAFVDAATWCLVNNASHRGTYYVSMTLNFLISRGLRVGYAEIPRSAYRSWSLPVDFSTQSE